MTTSRHAKVAVGAIGPVDLKLARNTVDQSLGQRSRLGDASPLALAPGFDRVIQQYEIIRELGHGGMGAVYLARDTRLGRLVAIKLLAERSEMFIERFLREARVTARCGHENIVVIHEAGEHQGHPFMVLEYLEGQNLREWMDEQGGAIAVQRAIDIILPVVRALDAAHRQGIVHRDLKPENIMITASGRIKVLDFGIAKPILMPWLNIRGFGSPTGLCASSPDLWERTRSMSPTNLLETEPGAIVGTLPYASPEQLESESVDHRTDIWALGIILHELVTGRHPLAPFNLDKLTETMDISEPMPSLRDLNPGLGALGSIVDRCLVKRRDDRTQSARELLDELEALVLTKPTVTLDKDRNPFAGLSAFQERDADWFFGRSRDIAEIVARLRRQPLLTLVGPSGAGKSSLIRAGVIPALKRSGEGWDAVVLRPGRSPLALLADILERVLAQTTAHDEPMETAAPETLGDITRSALIRRLREEPGYLAAELRTRANSKCRRILLFIDQFEELYTLTDDVAERAQVIACLEAVADDAASPLRVVLSVRSDFLDRMVEDRSFSNDVSRNLMLLAPVQREGLLEAITRPVEAAGHTFESPELVERMLDVLASRRGMLPLLQFTASQLWEARDRERRLLTEESYTAMGGVSGALAKHADTVLDAMSSRERSLARTILQRLVTPERTRAVVGLDELQTSLPDGPDGDSVERVVRHLADMRLVVLESGDPREGRTVELVHESLITSWPALARWLDEDADDAVYLARLRSAAREWEAGGRSDGLLWRSEPALEAKRWIDRYRGELPVRERAYINAVIALVNHTARTKQLAVVGTIALLTILLAAASVALLRIRGAEREASQRATKEKELSTQLLQSLTSERKQKEAAEKAQKEAEAATDRAAAEARRAQAAARDAREARDEARLSATEAKQAEGRAQEAKSRAERAKETAEKAEAKAQQSAEEERESRLRLERLRERAVGTLQEELQ